MLKSIIEDCQDLRISASNLQDEIDVCLGFIRDLMCSPVAAFRVSLPLVPLSVSVSL